MENLVEEIKSRLDILDVISPYLKLQKTGINYRALCPFHSEKSPSFFVSQAKQMWHCFGCGKSGDIFKFIMEIEGIEFKEALRILAQKAGVEIKEYHPEEKTKRTVALEICELATQFFEKQLAEGKTGKEVQEYLLKNRKLTEESIKNWRIGYAPQSWDALLNFLHSRGYNDKEIEEAGLEIRKQNGSFYDRFRGRIIFPIFDINSQTIGFSGRVFNEENKTAKYINTSNTNLYNKSNVLYGLNRAKMAIREQDSVIVLEGFFDVILSFQSGISNVVAVSGTALTPQQLKVLKRYTQNLILCFDMDLGGELAAVRGIDLAQSLGFDIKTIILPKGKDPADIISENPEKWKEAVNRSKSIYEFYMDIALLNNDVDTIDGRKKICKMVLPVFKRIPNEIEKGFWLDILAKKIKTKEEDLREEMKRIKTEKDVYGIEPEEEVMLPRKTRKELLEDRLMILVLNFPHFLDKINKELFEFLTPEIREFLTKKEKRDSVKSERFNVIMLRAEIEKGNGEENEKDFLKEAEFCLKEIGKIELKKTLEALSDEIKKSEAEKDLQKTEKLKNQFNKILQKIK